jgi:uridine phosphorylase
MCAMHADHINGEFLDSVLRGDRVDYYYHYGVDSSLDILTPLRDVRAIVMAGSGERIRGFADRWSRMNQDAPIIAFPSEDRFVTRYCHGVLFVSHGMGMPSASIAVQEAMRMLYFLKDGDLDALDQVFWARVGTSGGVDLPPGTMVLSTEALMADLKPFRLLQGGHGEYWFDGTFPAASRAAIIAANAGNGIEIVEGKTVSGNEFYLEQFRLDGAINFETLESKQAWLQWLAENGVRNVEMEGAMLAGYLNYWGFRRFAMICTTLLNRLEGDQVTSTSEELHRFTDQAGEVLFTYLATMQ